ncbi:hypothetical protein DERP_000842 [Dermatophagoides pteronyssinus]|uniref:Uncharacterized protein n=1 Tax=Dermatophagoides pteronyssinus TaxID=6956 RepID=A0ABQ8J1D8_DERPT|nr:hypothetical protein DERP_000842 [Dermatophagoides pteronyssinus]
MNHHMVNHIFCDFCCRRIPLCPSFSLALFNIPSRNCRVELLSIEPRSTLIRVIFNLAKLSPTVFTAFVI